MQACRKDTTDSVSRTVTVSATNQSPTITVVAVPSVSENTLTATVTSSDDSDVTRASFSIFNTSNTVLDTASLTVNSPSSTYNSAVGVYTWGYNSPTATTTTSWNIDISSLADGDYKIMFYATDGSLSVDSGYYSFTKNSAVDNPPVVVITTTGSEQSNNPKNANFDLSVNVTDDIGLSTVAYSVQTSISGSTGQNGSSALSGTSGSATFTIDVDSLAVGSYKIEVAASDSKPQASTSQWYWFQKVEAATSVPSITNLSIAESSTTEDFIFTAQLDGDLPANHSVFLNFDNLQGAWFSDTDDGGHIKLPDQSGNTYSKDTSLQKLGIRFFRAAIFNTQGDSDKSNDVRVSDWSDTATCTLPACLSMVSRPKNYGNPAATGGGSKLVQNVDLANGNYHLSKVDMAVSGLGPAFSFSRAYNSLHKTPWTFAYEMKATFIGDYDRELSIGPREDGHFQYFFKDMDDEWHALNPGDFTTLIEESNGSFTLYTLGNRLYRFADPSSAEAGRLQTIADRLGHALTFGYDGSNNLTSVTDAINRIYTITRDSGNRISRVTDFSGRYVEYTYDANDMITRVRKMRGDAYYDSYTYHSTSPTYLVEISDSRIAPTARFTIYYTLDYTNQPDRVDNITDADNKETSFLFGQSSKWGQYAAVVRPAVDGLNHNQVYLFDEQRMRITEFYDAKNASEARNPAEATTLSYKSAADNSRFADLALVTTSKDPENNSTSISYDSTAHGKPQTITDPLSRTTQAAYTTIANQTNLKPLASVIQPGVATPTQFGSFTSTGQAGTITDPENYTTNRSFDNSTGLLTHSTDPRTNTTSYTYDGDGNITGITDAKGNQTTRSYDSLGRLAAEITPLGLTTTYTYDAQGNVLTRTESDGADINYITQYSYDDSDNLALKIDPKDNQTTYHYDEMNRQIREVYTVAGVQYVKSYTYDALGRLATVTNERNQTRQTHYTERSKVKYKVNPLGKTTVTYTYDKNGNVTTVTDAENRTVTTTYDALNRKTRAVDDEGNSQTWTYNTAGQVASYTDARNKITTYQYDKVGNLTRLTDPNGGVTRSTYDGNGNLLTVTDPAGHTTTYAYDELNHRIHTTLDNGQYWSYTYDAAGNVLLETMPTGESIAKQYDALSRVTSLVERNSSGSVIRQISYTYDANSNITSQTSNGQTISYSYDEINRLTSITDQNGQTIAYGYDKAGNRTSLTYPGNKTVSYGYDEADRLSSLTDWLGKQTSYTRNDAGQLTRVVNGNGTITNYSYDDAGRLVLLENLKPDNSVISRHSMTLDGNGNITSTTATLPLEPAMPTSISSMTYDENNRILTAGGASFNHDATGRIIEEDDGQTTTYNFDINDRLTSVVQGGTTISSYSYDLNNSRISQTQNGSETRYVIDQLANLPNVVAEADNGNNISTYYVYGEGLVSQIDTTGTSHYYHFDPTGHTLALTDSNGNITDRYAYTPYGHTTVQGTTHNPFRFVGRYGVMDDGDGLHYMRARYYKEDIKRFMSLDALHGEALSPQSLNRYAYVLGNPVMGVDPSGLEYQGFWKEMKEGLILAWRGFSEQLPNIPEVMNDTLNDEIDNLSNSNSTFSKYVGVPTLYFAKASLSISNQYTLNKYIDIFDKCSRLSSNSFQIMGPAKSCVGSIMSLADPGLKVGTDEYNVTLDLLNFINSAR